MRTGLGTFETSACNHHLNAVISGAVAVLCQEAHRTMVMLDNMGDESEIPELFDKAIKYQMISGVAPQLTAIIEAIADSADGVPAMPVEHHEMLSRVMQDYPAALEASKQGVMKEYRANRMAYLARLAEEQLDGLQASDTFVGVVQGCVEQWDARGPQTPFERIIGNIITRV